MTALPDEQIVVRGGILNHQDLERSALTAFVTMGRSGFSVHSAAASTPSELLRIVGTNFPHDEVSFALAGSLREAGFTLEQTGAATHFSAFLPESADLSFWVSQFRTTMSMPVARDKADTVLPLT